MVATVKITVPKARANVGVAGGICTMLKLLGLTFDNEGKPADSAAVFVRDTLLHLNITGQTDAHNGMILVIPTMTLKYPDELAVSKGLMPLVTVISYLVEAEAEGTEVDFEEVTKSDLLETMSRLSAPAKNLQGKVAPKDAVLPAFSGRDADWTIWKEKAKQSLFLYGLSQVIEDVNWATMNPTSNKCVYALLTRAIAHEGFYITGAFFSSQEGDGYGAWQYLEDFYEKSKLVKAQITAQIKLVERMSYKLGETDFNLFIMEYVSRVNTVTVLQEKAMDKGVTNYDSKSDWKKELLKKLESPEFSGRTSKLDDDAYSLTDAIHELKVFVIENDKLAGKRGPKKGNNGESKGPEKAPYKEKEKDNGHAKVQSIMDKISSIASKKTGEEQKTITALLAEVKETASDGKKRGGEKQGGTSKKRHRQIRKRRTPANIDGEDPAEAVMDAAAAAVYGN